MSHQKEKKSNFFEKKLRIIKRPSEFSSLERIKIVVDGLIGDVSEKEICRNQGISLKVYLEWKNSFLKSFKKYSEIEILQKALTSKNRDSVIKELGDDAYRFYEKFLNVSSTWNLVIPKDKLLSNYDDFSNVKNIILLDKINNFRQINKQLEEVNVKIPDGGILMGSFETFSSRSKRRNSVINRIPVLKQCYAGLDFVFNRVFPKLPYVKKVYFNFTKGKDRLLSKAEALGRLVSCGFDILDYQEINGIHYFASIKIKAPAYNMNPSYGPLFKMQRVGKGGKMIGVYKFRTMHPYSEYLQDYILKLNGYAESGKPANDFRLVPWGKFLRRYWLDELPQLINVLKGELKLVGVRPVSKTYFDSIPTDIQELRLTQKPGCVPPYVSLNRKSSVESVLESEKEYLQEKIRNPYFTDVKFFFNAIFNIFFKGKRSA